MAGESEGTENAFRIDPFSGGTANAVESTDVDAREGWGRAASSPRRCFG